MSRHLSYTRLSHTEVESELLQRPGLIPVSFRSATSDVIWLDLGGLHCYEGFFRESLAVFARQRGAEREFFVSDFRTLVSAADSPECLPPAGFIFHAGRCGSTLLAKSLMRSRRNLVFSEAPIHNEIWEAMPILESRGFRAAQAWRTLALATGRRRLHTYDAHLIKFTSFNIVQYRCLREAFPDVPALFLFRDPAEILDSMRRGPAQWVGADLGTGMRWDSAEDALRAFFEAALSVHDDGLRCLDYCRLSPESLPAILRHFRIAPTDSELAAMIEEFAWDAKSGLSPLPFVPQKRDLVPAPTALRTLYLQLREHATLPVPDSIRQ